MIDAVGWIDDGCADGWMMDGQMDADCWMIDGKMDAQMDKCMDAQMDG